MFFKIEMHSHTHVCVCIYHVSNLSCAMTKLSKMFWSVDGILI